MEIRMKCEHEITLNQFQKLENITYDVSSYELKGDTLLGDVKIGGSYEKQGMDNIIHQGFEDLVPFTVVFRDENIKVIDIVIENNKEEQYDSGLMCSFELLVIYELISQHEDIIEVPYEVAEEIIKVSNENDNITEQYSKKLEEKFNVRDNNSEKIDFRFLPDNYQNINVYYLNNEKEIESIANEKRLAIENVLKNNNDFSKTRRIIINE